MAQINVFNRKVFLKDLTIATIIILLPFLFYLYLLVPEVKVWETPFFTIESNYFDDVRIFVWTAMTKLLTLFILSIWFVTCKHWWRYAILIPISMESFKLIGTINDDINFFDEYEFITSLPFTIPFIIILFILAIRLNYYNLSKNLDISLDIEINNLIKELSSTNSEAYKTKRNRFEALKKEKSNLKKKEYLKRLVALRNSLLTDYTN